MRQPDPQGMKTPLGSNESKIFFPAEKITKGDLLEYYQTISPIILPYLKDRPIVLRRFPNGIDEESFYQKAIPVHHPKSMKTVKIKHEERTIEYLMINNGESLLYAVNLGSIDLHPFTSRVKKIEYPDYCVLDLDPQELPFDRVVEVAQECHAILDSIQIPHYCKTSGGRGLHIYIPLHARFTHEQSRSFAEQLAVYLHEQMPQITSLERSPKKRVKQVYLDCLQNRFGQTLAASYSVRPKKGAPVSMPLDWEEVRKGLNPLDFTIKNVPALMKKRPDYFKPVLGPGVTIKMLERLGNVDNNGNSVGRPRSGR